MTVYKMMMNQIGQNLIDVGRLGSYLFDDNARKAIKRLDEKTEKNIAVSDDQIFSLKQWQILSSLTQESIDQLHSSDDFQLLLKLLQQITLASYQDRKPNQDKVVFTEVYSLVQNGAIATYLAVPIKQSPEKAVLKYLVSAAPYPTKDGWPGNPIGTLERFREPLAPYFDGNSHVDTVLCTDSFYTSLTAGVPIFTADGQILAMLGLDYAATQENHKLMLLSYLCYSFVLISFILSLLFSWYIAKRLGSPLQQLHDAALKISNNDYSAHINITSRDEFALLGSVFNQMAVNVHSTLKKLEDKNHQLAVVISDIHDGIGAILSSIFMISQNSSNTDPVATSENVFLPINRLAKQGVEEIRFLMNALEYKDIDFSAIHEEVELLAADILIPSGIAFEFDTAENTPTQKIRFEYFINIQRIFREVFTNTIKHSNASVCQVVFRYQENSQWLVYISDNGSSLSPNLQSSGRGLKNINTRIKQLNGTMESYCLNGFTLKFTIPLNLTTID